MNWNSALIKILILSVISSIILLIVMNNITKDIQFADFALAGKTTTVYEIHDDININNTTFNIDDNLSSAHTKDKNIIVSFGNSQSHSINNYDKNSDHLFSYYLNQYNDEIVLNLSGANGNIQEMFVSLVNTKKEFKDKLQIAIFSLVFDDTREEGIRKEMDEIVLTNKNILSQYLSGQIILSEDANDNSKNIEKHLLLKDKTEKYFNKYMENKFDSYKNRGNIGAFFYGELYHIRNYILGISPSSKRKKINRLYAKNMQALKDIISYCKQNNITPILYVAPIRYDAEMPYEKSEYLQFKMDIKNIYDIYDLDDIVPSKYWGVTNGDWLDFMHFKGEGHKILAKELQKIIIKKKVGK